MMALQIFNVKMYIHALYEEEIHWDFLFILNLAQALRSINPSQPSTLGTYPHATKQ